MYSYCSLTLTIADSSTPSALELVELLPLNISSSLVTQSFFYIENSVCCHTPGITSIPRIASSISYTKGQMGVK